MLSKSLFYPLKKLSLSCILFCMTKKDGLDHSVGHLLLLLYDAKAPHCRKNKAFKGLGHYAEWPKVADAVIKARKTVPCGKVFISSCRVF